MEDPSQNPVMYHFVFSDNVVHVEPESVSLVMNQSTWFEDCCLTLLFIMCLVGFVVLGIFVSQYTKKI